MSNTLNEKQTNLYLCSDFIGKGNSYNNLRCVFPDGLDNVTLHNVFAATAIVLSRLLQTEVVQLALCENNDTKLKNYCVELPEATVDVLYKSISAQLRNQIYSPIEEESAYMAVCGQNRHLNETFYDIKSKFDIIIAYDADKKVLDICYNSSRFRQTTINCIYNMLLFVLLHKERRDIMTSQIFREYTDLSILEGQRIQCTQTLPGLFQIQVELSPDVPALVFHETAFTYRELYEQVRICACKLADQGVGHKSLVGLMMSRGIHLVVTILALMEIGAAYLPLDPDYPIERIEYIVKDSGIRNVIVEKLPQSWKSSLLTPIFIEDCNSYLPQMIPVSYENNTSDFAYVIYTSGSTGSPKGVPITQGNIVNTINWRIREYGFLEGDNVLMLSPVTFDAFLTSFFTPLLSGATVVLPDDNEVKNPEILAEYIVKYDITSFICIPTLYEYILEALKGKEYIHLKSVTLAGETISPTLIKKSKSILPDVEIINEYGPTECSVASTIERNLRPDEVITIGGPIDNTNIYVVDISMNVLPVLCIGEICIQGLGVASAYINQHEISEKSFLFSSFSQENVLYRTGDYGRINSQGKLEFIGRKDRQAKVNGFRISLDEIENEICGYSLDILLAAAIVNEGQIETYFTATAIIDKEKLRGHIKNILPSYAVPSTIQQIEEMHLLPSGKIDYNSLQYHQKGAELNEKDITLETLETQVRSVWTQILNTVDFGIDESFFDVGGNSISLMKMSNLINERFNANIEIAEIFATPTIRDIVGLLEGKIRI